MAVVEPLAILAAVFALLACGAWMRVVRRTAKVGGAGFGDVLGQAAVVTAITLALGAAAILVPLLVDALIL